MNPNIKTLLNNNVKDTDLKTDHPKKPKPPVVRAQRQGLNNGKGGFPYVAVGPPVQGKRSGFQTPQQFFKHGETPFLVLKKACGRPFPGTAGNSTLRSSGRLPDTQPAGGAGRPRPHPHPHPARPGPGEAPPRAPRSPGPGPRRQVRRPVTCAPAAAARAALSSFAWWLSSSARHSRRRYRRWRRSRFSARSCATSRVRHGPSAWQRSGAVCSSSLRRWTSAHSQRMSSSCRSRREATASAASASAAMALAGLGDRRRAPRWEQGRLRRLGEPGSRRARCRGRGGAGAGLCKSAGRGSREEWGGAAGVCAVREAGPRWGAAWWWASLGAGTLGGPGSEICVGPG